MSTPPARGRRLAAASAVPVGLLLSGALVWQSSNAAFTASTTNPGNSWAAGTVVLTDDDSDGALFSVSNLHPGDTGTKCITVTYTGTLASTVKLYVKTADQGGTGLDTYLDLTVTQGSGGSYADCTGFRADALGDDFYTGTLAGFETAHTSHLNGFGTFAPADDTTATPQTKTYMFTYTLQDNNDAQGLTAETLFTWEAQNS